MVAGISRLLRNVVISWLVGGLVGGLLDELNFGLNFGLSGGLRFGGRAYLHHFALRWHFGTIISPH
jgi:hypothetical protein